MSSRYEYIVSQDRTIGSFLMAGSSVPEVTSNLHELYLLQALSGSILDVGTARMQFDDNGFNYVFFRANEKALERIPAFDINREYLIGSIPKDFKSIDLIKSAYINGSDEVRSSMVEELFITENHWCEGKHVIRFKYNLNPKGFEEPTKDNSNVKEVVQSVPGLNTFEEAILLLRSRYYTLKLSQMNWSL